MIGAAQRAVNARAAGRAPPTRTRGTPPTSVGHADEIRQAPGPAAPSRQRHGRVGPAGSRGLAPAAPLASPVLLGVLVSGRHGLPGTKRARRCALEAQ